MGQVNWTDEAEQSLRAIFDYIAQDNYEAASRTVEGIQDRAQLLADYPEIGYPYHEIPGRHIRILLYGHYRIVYLIKTNAEVDILGVLHGAMNIDRFFQ